MEIDYLNYLIANIECAIGCRANKKMQKNAQESLAEIAKLARERAAEIRLEDASRHRADLVRTDGY